VDDVCVIGVSGKAQATAILHKFFEFTWLVKAELVNCYFLLLSSDVIIFFVLRATW
jgi:hypothetical protein